MIELEMSYLTRLQEATSAQEVHEFVQKAIELEFATIPPYLTARMSLHPNQNNDIRGILRTVAKDEMLHMLITCNLLNALGGRPVLDSPHLVPNYPSTLPMGVNSGLVVGLEKLSKDYVAHTFMGIEQPEEPIVFPEARAAFATIGQFYETLKDKVRELGDGAFDPDTSRQVIDNDNFDEERLFVITDVATAVRAIDVIVREGEGTAESPIGEPGKIAHYYRFEQIVRGRELVKDDAVPEGFSFTGDEVPFDADAVFPITANQKLSGLDPGSEAGQKAREFAEIFTSMLKGLHQAVNGKRDMYEDAVFLMATLGSKGSKLCAIPAVFDGQPTGLNAGPAWEYVDG